MSPDDHGENGHEPDMLASEDGDDMLAAEYALGTLRSPELDEAEALIAAKPEFAARVRGWEARLGELHALSVDIEAPAAIWTALQGRLPEAAGSGTVRLPEISRRASFAAARRGTAAGVEARLRRWRTATAALGAMAAVLALFVVTAALAPTLLPDALRPKPRVIVQMAEATASPPPRFVAVLQRDAAAPAFILTVDVANRTLVVRRVAAERETGKSFELWLVSDKFPAPRSLGIVDGGEFTRSNALAPYEPGTIADASFAVSLEPAGGSPTGAPSNTMFLGKLVQSLPAPPATTPPR